MTVRQPNKNLIVDQCLTDHQYTSTASHFAVLSITVIFLEVSLGMVVRRTVVVKMSISLFEFLVKMRVSLFEFLVKMSIFCLNF